MKFKCAKCGKLFPQKEVEAESFQRWNKKQREIDEHNLKVEDNKKREEHKEKKIFRRFRLLFKEKRKRISLEGCHRDYYEDNKEKILARKKIYRQLHKERNNEWRKEYRAKFMDRTKLLGRVHYWRRQQAKLTQQELEINGYGSYTNGLDDSFSTFGLVDLLTIILILYL